MRTKRLHLEVDLEIWAWVWDLFLGLVGAVAFLVILTLILGVPEILAWIERRRTR